MASFIRIDSCSDSSTDIVLTPPDFATTLVVTAWTGDLDHTVSASYVNWNSVAADSYYSRSVPGQHSMCGIWIFERPAQGTYHLHANSPFSLLGAYWIGGEDSVNPVGDEYDNQTDGNVTLTVTHIKTRGCVTVYAGSKSSGGVSLSGCTTDVTESGAYSGVSGHEVQTTDDLTSQATVQGSNNVAGVAVSITNRAGGGKKIQVW